MAKHPGGLEPGAVDDYVDRYLSAWVGAYLHRQRCYGAELATAKQNMTADDRDRWTDGKPTHEPFAEPKLGDGPEPTWS